MSTTAVFILVFVAALVALSIVYVIIVLSGDGRILTSTVNCPDYSGSYVSDQYYFLPTASLTIQATAKVLATRTADGTKITDTKLMELKLENSIAVVPDTRRLISVDYHPSIFAADELRLTTTASGLLQGVTAVAEDRIGPIITQLSDAPHQILTRDTPTAFNFMLEGPVVFEKITETLVYTNTFVILPADLRKSEFTVSWSINVDGDSDNGKTTVDTSFRCSLEHKAAYNMADLINRPVDGLFTRPLVETPLKLFRKTDGTEFDAEPSLTYSLLVPDESRLITVPVKRALFVKAKRVPVFTNGLLTENYIAKPSEVEAALSLLIAPLKAIVAIPGQLLSFRINHLKQETSLQTEQMNLAKALRAAADASGKSGGNPPATPPSDPLADLQNKVADISRQQAVSRRPPDNSPPLGKANANLLLPFRELSAIVKPSFFAESALLKERGIAAPATGLPDPVFPVDLHKKMSVPWGSYGNDINNKVQDCVPAAAAHLIMLWTQVAKGTVTIPAETDVVAAYKAISGFDPGTGANNDPIAIDQLLDRWQNAGIGSDKLTILPVPIVPQKKVPLFQSVMLFGGCLVGLKMPLSAKKQTQWAVPPDGAIDNGSVNGIRNSWGGHCVAVVGYDETFIACVSWGNLILMTHAFYETYNDESYSILSNDWINSQGFNPNGLNLDQLKTNLASIDKNNSNDA